ncbi:MAG: hypothetical protein AB1779_07730, partial [Candidatus Thermoplasmatota archaeon]
SKNLNSTITYNSLGEFVRKIIIFIITLSLLLIPIPLGAQQITGGKKTTLYFTGETLTPIVPPGNATEKKDCPGRLYGARYMGTSIGTWNIGIKSELIIDGPFSAKLWAKSDENAKGVSFRINIYKNDKYTDNAYFTDSKTIGSTPTDFKAEGSLGLNLVEGDTLGIQIVYFSQPKHFIGPSASSTFLYGSSILDSQVTISASPISLNISEPHKAKDHVCIKATVRDSLIPAPVSYPYSSISVSGPTDGKTFSIVKFGGSGNETTVDWEWYYKKDGAKSGEYEITITVGYDKNVTVSNSSKFSIELPEEKKTKGFIPGFGGFLFIFAVISFVFLRKLKV